MTAPGVYSPEQGRKAKRGRFAVVWLWFQRSLGWHLAKALVRAMFRA